MEPVEKRVQLSASVPSTEFIWADSNLPQRIVSTFDQDVSGFSADDVEVLNLDTDQPEPVVYEGYDPGTHRATLRFPGVFEGSGMLASDNIHLVEPTDFCVVARSLLEDPNIGIRVSWDADPAVHQWRVERNGYDGQGYVPISGWLDSTTTFYDDSNLADGTWYSYRVRGRDTSGNLVAYTPHRGDFTVLPGPSDVGAALLADNQVGLWWTDNSSSEARFVIEWAPAGTNFDPAQIQSLVVGTDQTTAVVSAPQSLANVELRVRAEIDGPVQSTPRNANPPSEVAYTDTFSGQPGGRSGFLNPVWTNARYDWAATDRRFLGLYQDEQVGLYLPNLPPHAKINLWIDYLGWDYGGGSYELTVRADGQEYTADEWMNWGYALTDSNGLMYVDRVHYSIPHISSQVALTFSGSGYEAFSSYWGMWDIQVMLEYPIVSFFQSEGQYAEEGGRNAELYVMRTADLTYPLDIPFSVLNGTAQSEDYQLQPSGSLHLDCGQGVATITASAADDTTPEWTEDFLVRLGGSRRYFLDPVSAGRQLKVEIVDNNDGSITGLPDVLEVNNDDDDDSGTPDMDQNDYDADGYPDWDNVPSLSGEDELYPIQLDFPQAPKPGATLSLSRGNNSPIRVMQSNDRGGIAFINEDRGGYTWTLGQNDPPRTLWVEAVGGSASEADVVLTLTYDDSTATTRPIHPTSATTTSQPATNVGIQIISTSAGDVTGKTVDWLIGQKADLTAYVQAPPTMANPTAYAWNVPGNVLYDYAIDSAGARTVALAPDIVTSLPTGGTLHVGTAQQVVRFFWVSTSDPGPDLHTVKVDVTIPGVGVRSREAKFKVHSPVPTVNTAAHGSPFIADLGEGHIELTFNNPPWAIVVGATVKQPAGFAQGQWTFLQMLNSNDEYQHWQADGTVDRYLWSRNGSWVLDGSFPPPSQLILDANLQSQGASTLLTGPSIYNWADAPGDTVARNGRHVGIGSATGPDLHEVRRNEQYRLYVMYLPPGDESEWVPLRSMNWSWAVDAKDPNKDLHWQIISATAPTDSGWTRETSHPTWNAVWQDGTWVKQ